MNILKRYSELEAFLKKRQNVIIAGPPGCGKSFTARKLYPEARFLRGTISAPALIRNLALIASENKPMTVILDDCEDLIKKNINLFKAILDTDHPYAEWEKSMGPLLRQLSKDEHPKSQHLYHCLMEFFNGVGLTIPTHNIHFIVLTNESIADRALLSRCEYGVCETDFAWLCDALKLNDEQIQKLKRCYSGNDIRKALGCLEEVA